jgi:predicted porin
MKKSLVALAVLAAAGAASAQSSVTLFGIVDAGIAYSDAKTDLAGGGSAKNKQYGMMNSGYNSSRLGFRGTEDLGGGLAAGFWLEAPLGVDSGTISSGNFFNRRSTVSLSGGFGEIRLGRDYTPTFWNDTTFDPFGTNGVGTNIINVAHSTPSTLDGSYVRSSNGIGYFLPPNLGGFYGQAQFSFDENVSGSANGQAGRYAGGRFGYANGPLDVALAYGQSKTVDTVATETKVKTANLGASYDLGVVKLFGELSQVRVDTETALGSTSPKINGWLFGATAPVGAGLIRASVGQARYSFEGPGDDPRATKFALGYVHNLSKRTALYTTFAHTSNKDGSVLVSAPSNGLNGVVFPAGGEAKSSNGYEFGIRHSF